MLESFFRTHQYLVEHTEAPVRRALMDEINWKSRLIGIKGSRGVGKTTFLLQYARENYAPKDHRCLYVNMNNFYFQGKSLTAFLKNALYQTKYTIRNRISKGNSLRDSNENLYVYLEAFYLT